MKQKIQMKNLFYKVLSWFGFTYYPTLGGVPRTSKYAKLAKEFIKMSA